MFGNINVLEVVRDRFCSSKTVGMDTVLFQGKANVHTKVYRSVPFSQPTIVRILVKERNIRKSAMTLRFHAIVIKVDIRDKCLRQPKWSYRSAKLSRFYCCRCCRFWEYYCTVVLASTMASAPPSIPQVNKPLNSRRRVPISGGAGSSTEEGSPRAMCEQKPLTLR